MASHAISTLSFPRGSAVLDAQFADDAHLLVLLQTPTLAPSSSTKPNENENENENLILSIPYTSNSAVTYTPIPDPTLPSTLLPDGQRAPDSVRVNHDITPDMLDKYTRHVFEGRFTPLKLVVNGRRARRVVVVLGSDRKHYRVLDLDYRSGAGGSEGGNEEGEREGDEDEDVEMGGA